MMLVVKLFETECLSSMLPPGFGARTSRKVADSGKGYDRNLVYLGQLTMEPFEYQQTYYRAEGAFPKRVGFVTSGRKLGCDGGI